MTDDKIRKLAAEISSSINDCLFCAIKEDCGKSEYGTCDGVWEEHLFKLENESKNGGKK